MPLTLSIDVGGIPNTPQSCELWQLKLDQNTPAINGLKRDEARELLRGIPDIQSVVFPCRGEVYLHVKETADRDSVKQNLERVANGEEPELNP